MRVNGPAARIREASACRAGRVSLFQGATRLRGLLAALVLLTLSASTAAAKTTPKPEGRAAAHRPTAVPLPVRGSGRLVKQVAQTPTRTRQARVGVSTPALLARAPSRESTLRSSLKLPAIELWHITSHQTFSLRPDVKGGDFSRKQLAALSTFLRCHYTNKRHAMESRLISLIYATARHFNNGRVTIISGYRAPKVAKMKGNPKSPHKRGVACDFRIDGVAVTELRDYLRRTYHGIGVGYYPISNFVHLDVGRQQDAFWIDYSGPGERARYSNAPDEDLRSGVAERAASGDSEGEEREAPAKVEAKAEAKIEAAPALPGAPLPGEVHTQGDL